jgi:hypothetical protein
MCYESSFLHRYQLRLNLLCWTLGTLRDRVKSFMFSAQLTGHICFFSGKDSFQYLDLDARHGTGKPIGQMV